MKTFKDLCIVVKEMHNKNIFHLDLKPENILINSDLEFKIIDFGSAV